MTISRLVRAGLASGMIACAALLSSCGDQPSPLAPSARSIFGGLHGDQILGISLLSCSPLPYDSTSQLVGPDGGTINVGVYSLAIPPGALNDTVTITAVAPTGNVNLVQFQPAGLHFNGSAQLTMSYANCGILGSLLPRTIAYTSDNLDILYLLPTIDDVFTHSVTGQVKHFSDYAVAW